MKALTKKELTWLIIGILAIGMFLGTALICFVYLNNAEAESDIRYGCWVMCQPDSEVLIRERPSRRSEDVGAACLGKKLWTDWQEKNGFIHLIDLNNETGDGWIFEGYVVFEEPFLMNVEITVHGCRRVACRTYIDGKRSKWAKSGTIVEVYAVTSEWAVSNKGFIQVDYLRAE